MIISQKYIPHLRLKDYMTQDLNAGRSVDNYITLDEVIKLLENITIITIMFDL